MAENDSKASSRILGRGLKLLECLAESPQGLSVRELGDMLHMHRTSVYRYLKALLATQYAKRNADGRYHVGPRMFEITGIALAGLDLRNVAHPYLLELSESTEATVHMCQLNGLEMVYIDKVETSRSLPLFSRIGARAPVYATGVGKALLAFSPPERREMIISSLEMRPYTPKTIVDKVRFAEELDAIGKRGYALDQGEHEEGIACLAAPIVDLYGEVIAALSITDIERVIVAKEAEYAAKVRDVAQRVSHEMGYHPESLDQHPAP